MNESIRCVSVSLSKTKAIVSVNTIKRIVKPISCSNSKSCINQGVIQKGCCPDVCEIIIAVKRYVRKRRVKAEIDELCPEKCQEILKSSGDGISIDPSFPPKILPNPS
ncbi:MAG TPA: hypothetical protein EYP30_09105 [Archaeoglobaceae archaeon]|nr:hypothetical protein [Archaeoglobaceae archaeon]